MVIGLVEPFILWLGILMRHRLIGIILGALMITGCTVDVYPTPAYAPIYTNPVIVHRPYIHHHYRWNGYYGPHWQYRYQRRYWR